MHFYRKSNSTIIDIRHWFARSWILFIKGSYALDRVGTLSQSLRLPIGASYNSTSRS
jgi:hypothetical protein